MGYGTVDKYTLIGTHHDNDNDNDNTSLACGFETRDYRLTFEESHTKLTSPFIPKSASVTLTLENTVDPTSDVSLTLEKNRHVSQ